VLINPAASVNNFELRMCFCYLFDLNLFGIQDYLKRCFAFSLENRYLILQVYESNAIEDLFFFQRKHFPWQFWHRIRSGIYLKIGICSCFLFGSHFLVSEYVSLSMQFSSNCMLGAYIARPATLSPHAVTFIDSLLDTTCLVGLHCTMEAHLFLHFRSWEHLNYTHITDCKL
jgi:hypothetical protein